MLDEPQPKPTLFLGRNVERQGNATAGALTPARENACGIYITQELGELFHRVQEKDRLKQDSVLSAQIPIYT